VNDGQAAAVLRDALAIERVMSPLHFACFLHLVNEVRALRRRKALSEAQYSVQVIELYRTLKGAQ
jgi:hypothetical protein